MREQPIAQQVEPVTVFQKMPQETLEKFARYGVQGARLELKRRKEKAQ